MSPDPSFQIPSSSRPRPENTLLSVVLPVYNEVQVLTVLAGRIVKALWNSNVRHEIIFVDDGSTDGSGELLDRLAADCPVIRVVHFARNFGHQAAVQAGLAYARGDAVVLMDSDLQDAPEAIPEMLRRWQAGEDAVYAIRTKRKESRWKRLAFAAFHRLMARSAAAPIPAEAGIFGLIDRRIAQEILTLPERDRYFPGLRSWVGLRQSGIPVERQARYDAAPRVSLSGLFRLAKTAIFSFTTLPLTVIHAIALLAAAALLALGGFALGWMLFAASGLPGWTSAALLGSFFTALNALGFSILGEYLIRIYDQVRSRPLYLVDRTVNIPSSLSLRERAGVRADESADKNLEEIPAYSPTTQSLYIPDLIENQEFDQLQTDLLQEAEALLAAAERAARQSPTPAPAPFVEQVSSLPLNR
ncbi:MAG: glycosyltransferase family 2 protein [Pirellulales bacterium]|nr:glycosyltransferase family 2 protein [Pirellulales bacterium]